MVIETSITVLPDHYHFPADSSGAIIIRGDSITVDFAGAVLDGALSGQLPDEFAGTGIRIEGGSGIIIKNVRVKGYKIGLLATDTPGIRITESDFSYNYRQHLKSTIEREHIDDWMGYHNNEYDEWYGYGAAVYLRRADGAQVDHIRVTGGQNGIMITEVNDGLFFNNEITFNSGIGIGMYRSSRNRLQHNKLDWNVRGYSHGVYNRGQDSAAILLYEQSSENTIAYNSATHSGDGLFLWAGQSTMDNGLGGCNDNLIYRNDFSWAPTNGIEVTFSRNQIIQNRIEGCWHGIWGGYSFDTEIIGNYFSNNEEHIAIEHGQDITIRQNQFVGGKIGFYAWERESQPTDWGYSQNRDVRSQNFQITKNQFEDVPKPLQIRKTDTLEVALNTFSNLASIELTEANEVDISVNGFFGYTTLDGLSLDGNWSKSVFNHIPESKSSEDAVEPPALIDGWLGVTLPETHPQTREYILVDEWGPVDFRSPELWPRSPRKQIQQEFELVGPAGHWNLVSSTGIDSFSVRSGSVPGSLTLWRSDTDVVDIDIQLEYSGSRVTDRFGEVASEGQPFDFGYNYFFVPINWDVKWFNYSEETDPRERPEAFRALINGDPVAKESTSDLGYQWYRSPAEGVEQDHFATVVTGQLSVPQGMYRLDLTSDDGVRVWVDDVLVHDDWTYHAPKLAEIELELGGNHTIRIEHFEINGYSTIVASLLRIKEVH